MCGAKMPKRVIKRNLVTSIYFKGKIYLVIIYTEIFVSKRNQLDT